MRLSWILTTVVAIALGALAVRGQSQVASDGATGRLEVRLAPATDTRHFFCSVTAEHRESNRQFRAQPSGVGRFSIAELPVGQYTVIFGRVDARLAKDPVEAPLPLLGWIGPQLQTRTPTEIRAGETTQLALRSPWLTWVQGRVTCAGQPAAKVIVFARSTETHHPDAFRESGRSTGCASMRTGDDGRFRFGIAGAGEWNFHARAPNSPHTTTPITVTIRRDQVGTELALPRMRIAIGAHTVTGTLSLPQHHPERNDSSSERLCNVWLLPIEIAHLDPVDPIDSFARILSPRSHDQIHNRR